MIKKEKLNLKLSLSKFITTLRLKYKKYKVEREIKSIYRDLVFSKISYHEYVLLHKVLKTEKIIISNQLKFK